MSSCARQVLSADAALDGLDLPYPCAKNNALGGRFGVIGSGKGVYQSTRTCAWDIRPVKNPGVIVFLEFAMFETEECCDPVHVYFGARTMGRDAYACSACFAANLLNAHTRRQQL